MIYNLQHEVEQNNCQEKLLHLIKKGAEVELVEKRKKRTLSQNSYLHVLFSLFGVHFGLTLEESKQLIKNKLKHLLRYEKKGKQFFKGTRELDTKELTVFIDKFRHFSSINAELYLPTPEEYNINRSRYDSEIQQGQEFL